MNRDNQITPDTPPERSNPHSGTASRFHPNPPSIVSFFTNNLVHLNVVDSTNNYAVRDIAALPHHSVIIADTQTGGKGRLQRTWISDSSDNLYMSFVIKPDRPYTEIPLVNFTQYLSLCLCRVFSGYGISPIIKWPNDVLVNGGKIAGILSETVFEGSRFLGMVLGVGVNLNSDPSASHTIDQSVTSLAALTGETIDKIFFAQTLFADYLEEYERFVSGGFGAIKQDFMNYFPHMGKEVMIKNSTDNGLVTVRGVSDSGELIIEDGSGSIKNLALGDMVWNS